MALPSSDDSHVPSGGLQPQQVWGELNRTAFIVAQIMSKAATAKLVQVVACSNSGSVAAPGTVDVVPMVHQIDGAGQTTPHATIYNVPYTRLQGGANAVIIDPQPGDIGIAIFADRDSSIVKATKKSGPPGSRRQFAMSDALYVGGLLNGTPSQFVRFSASGIVLHSAGTVVIDAPGGLTVNGDTTLTGGLTQGTGGSGGPCTMHGPLTVAQDVTAGGISLHNHDHTTHVGPPV